MCSRQTTYDYYDFENLLIMPTFVSKAFLWDITLASANEAVTLG